MQLPTSERQNPVKCVTVDDGNKTTVKEYLEELEVISDRAAWAADSNRGKGDSLQMEETAQVGRSLFVMMAISTRVCTSCAFYKCFNRGGVILF